ncbi:succinyl-diaminopimelate desuccinylase [Polycladidibacter hongkongensis]|uniref:succinyl-diaminopimelate desuccinylase n=1 Tax=Polycladidibacter hongkongensis TaxID=1647556 RepID=UPI0008353854|nr:succinyl-diaminopimelate desuccinylase [Pseudovibrio hongkongensis]
MTEQLSLATKICQDLIRCPSVTPSEAGALETLEAYLVTAGFTVERPVFSEQGTPDVENLFATIGSGSPHFVFAGHTDVVPVGEETDWRHPPFSGQIADGMIHGRGTADMKGGVASFTAAVLRYLEEVGGTPAGTISFLITGDEEGPAINGTVKLLEWAKQRGHTFDACIVGEPTNPDALGDAIKVGRRGSLSGFIEVEGVQGHVAYQHLACNPVPAMAKIVSALTETKLDEGNERFQPSNLEVTTIDVGNAATNIIPARVKAGFNIRFNDIWNIDTLKAKIETVVTKASPDEVTVKLSFKPDSSDSFLTHDATLIEALSQSVAAVTGRTPALSTNGGTSDARFIKNYCPVVEFGLVGKTMHKVDEQVAVADLDQLAIIYQRFLQDYFAAAN